MRRNNTVGVWGDGCSPMFTSLARSWISDIAHCLCVMYTLHNI